MKRWSEGAKSAATFAIPFGWSSSEESDAGKSSLNNARKDIWKAPTLQFPSSRYKSPRPPTLSSSTKTQDEVKCRLLLDVVVRERTSVLELLAGEDEALLVRGNALLVLDLSLDVIDRVGRLDLERDGCERRQLRPARERSENALLPVSVLTKICIPPRRRRTR